MAKPKTNLIILDDKLNPNLLTVWTPTPTAAKELVETIEGVVRAHHATEGYLNIRLNPCYDKNELRTEIKAILSDISSA